jgi:hypothetical protein
MDIGGIMAASDKSVKGRWRECIAQCWQRCLDLALVLWIVRVPLCAVIVGFLILDYTPQAQDLFTEFADSWIRIAVFLALLTVVWAATTHYASRLLLDTDVRFRAYADPRVWSHLGTFERWVPRLLGLIPFIVVLIASERSIFNLPHVEDKDVIAAITYRLRVFDVLVVAVGAVFLLYTVKRRDLMATGLVRRAEAKVSIVNRLLQPLGLAGDGRRHATGAPTNEPALGPLLLLIVFVLSALVIIFGADQMAEWLPRALAVPVILGGWLPLLTFLSGLGRQIRAPLIVACALVIAALSAILGDNHSVRRVDANALLKRPVDKSAIQLNQALDLWMKENECAGKPGSCPRPLIIVGSGGASRAGFFTASIIGDLLDQARYHVARQGGALDASKIRKRIFAISAVSGSAPSTAMSVAALARAGAATEQPCVNRTPELWYGEKINNWRDCLEALMAGDFLTPTMIGLTFHDMIRFGWWRDRAALLERSWELRFANVMGIKRGGWQGGCPGDLRCPFMDLRPREGLWLPLLLFNGASAATGQRLITTVLDSKYMADRCPTERPREVASELQAKSRVRQTYVTEQAPAKGTADTRKECPLFMEATRFHTLLTDNTDVDFWARIQRYFLWEYVREKFPFNLAKQNLDDVRLSTAATNSARFPVISPPGAVRNARHNVVDRIVDGGYIENYGAITAMELAVAIHTAQPDLAPFVLIISNDPDENPIINQIDVPDAAFLTDVSIPLQAIASARTGRGRLAVQQLDSVLEALSKAACKEDTAHIRVWPQYVEQGIGEKKKKTSLPVSLSWWLSTPIQIHLHQQTEGAKNQNENGSEIEKTWRALEDTSGCMTARR